MNARPHLLQQLGLNTSRIVAVLAISVALVLQLACPSVDEAKQPEDDGASGAKPDDGAEPAKPEPSV